MPFSAAEYHAITELAWAASDAILRVSAQAMNVERKSDLTPVTAADMASHHVIVPALRQLAPRVPVVSEEGADALEWSMAARYWLVDPLDGTKGYMRGETDYTVNIALMEGDQPLYGLIAIPAQHVLYYSSEGGAFRLRKGGAPEALQVKAQTAQRVLVSRSHLDAQTEQYLQGRELGEVKAVGSAVKFCRIAEGEADLYPRFGPTMEWDTAAGQAIVEAAGGSVITPEGERFRYGKHGWLNGPFIARSAA